MEASKLNRRIPLHVTLTAERSPPSTMGRHAVTTRKTDGAPAAGAKTSLEVFLSDTHPAPNSNQRSTEGPAGTYAIGPVRFDAAGQWTVRFHLYEECSELLDTSPHGHVAFYIWVP